MTLVPVSYTHLTAVQADPESFSYDDLKEGYDTPEATTITLTNTGNTTEYFLCRMNLYYHWKFHLSTVYTTVTGLISVSYTHLDVYKRQDSPALSGSIIS